MHITKTTLHGTDSCNRENSQRMNSDKQYSTVEYLAL